MSFSQAFQTLRKVCADALFQPETPDTPIQVLGLLESAGVEFDHLWVTGLTDEAWPLKSSPNPFLPLAQQRKAGIPEASAETSLALDRRITDGWKQAAGEVVFSYFTKEEDRDVLPSPLIADLPEKAVEIPAFSKLRDVIFASRKTETLQDRVAPAVRKKQVRGGTRVLSDQAACPFRAFARHRLHAEELEEPAEGLTAKRWQGERPDEPQLPLYAVSAKEEITAVVFAKFRPGDMRFVGLARDDQALPKVPRAKDGWQPLLRDWKKEAERLGRSFAAGEAGVDPKKDLMTCRYCGLETLCRVYEKINVLVEEEFEE